MNNVCFIAAGDYSWGSSRMRCYWPAKYMDNAVVVQAGQPIPQADAYIWQKTIDHNFVKATPQAKHWFDACDPSWWWQPKEFSAIIGMVDGVACSSKALSIDLRDSMTWPIDREIPIVTISDRLDPDHFTKQRQHREVDPVRLIWFGVSVNRVALFAALANLERLKANGYNVELTIFDNEPQANWQHLTTVPIYHKLWSVDTEVETLASHDIALLPPYPGAWGRVKSNNKKLTAWACGLPIADGIKYDELRRLVVEPNRRDTNFIYGTFLFWQAHHARNSANDWQQILGRGD